MDGGQVRWLVIGNSRWHWATPDPRNPGALISWETPPPSESLPAAVAPVAWAAVGTVPETAGLSVTARLALSEVPLDGVPPWLGIDRALASWWAWRRWSGPLLVVDAGTVLSLNRIDRSGRFIGGRLLAGLTLQWQAMAVGTAGLPDTLAVPGRGFGALSRGGQPPWPLETQEAMLVGVSKGLAAAIVAATLECEQDGLRLVLTGGDAPIIKPLIGPFLARWGIPLEHEPDLCLAALAALRPLPEPGVGRRRGGTSPS